MGTIDKIIIEWFNTGFGGAAPSYVGNILLIVISLLLAAIFSGALGYEREYYGHAAGLRTHLLVAVGSALVMIISIYGFQFWDASGATRDPARLAAQVVTGIGFLGAGTIMQTGTDIKGLTTATTIWIAMAVGLACGSGNFVIAAIATIISYVCLVVMRKVEVRMAKRHPMVMVVLPSDKPMLKDLLLIASRYSISIRSSESELVNFQGTSALRILLHCSFATQSSITAFADEIRFSLRPLVLKISTDVGNN